MRLSIGFKLGIGFALVMLLIGSVMYLGLSGFNSISEAYEAEIARISAAAGVRVEVSDTVRATVNRHWTLMWGLAIMAIIGATAVQILFTRGTAGPVRRTFHAALRLAGGDLTIPKLQIHTGDEIEEMAQAFNRMLTSLKEIISQIQRTGVTLTEHARQLLNVADETTAATAHIAAAISEVAQGTDNQVQHMQRTGSAMGELKKAIEQIAAGATRQAQQMEATTRLFEEIKQAIDQVADSARQVAEAAAEGTRRAESGGQAMEQVVEGITQVRVVTGQVAQHINELRGYSVQIGQIVELIGEIAEQTNLLALNAAIEAARAGEHGRGFGVVADEVRRLAVRAGESTQEISRLIANIQTAVDAAVEAIGAGGRHVETSTELAGRARDELQEIIAAINTTDDMARTISAAAQQMAAAGPKMLEAMDEMARITQENAAATQRMTAASDNVIHAMDEVAAISEETAGGAEQVSASTQQVNASAQTMKESVKELTDLADHLAELVGRFKVQ
ncbi:MAG: hypothetical protein BAA04_06540 [Firmicutes bacterium ZCTH02-B6]|nr:MAG: hypothetical protein BAA04_06540 [Firmicutes bacterium ZCTH02-B6]